MSNNTLSLGDRMKTYENAIDFKLNPCMQYVIRLDGKGFSKMIKKWKCEKPFDERFNKAMNYASKKLFDIIPNIKAVWHGSDEISIWFQCPNVEDMYFEGRIQKLVSLTASQASVYFNKKLQELFKDNTLPFGIFDSRLLQLPNEMEVSNYFIFRQRDHIRNSISGYAQYYFSHKELMKKNSDEKLAMMLDKGIDYNQEIKSKYWSKYGTLLYKDLFDIEKDTGERYQRSYIKTDEQFEFTPCKFGIILYTCTNFITEEEWKRIKDES